MITGMRGSTLRVLLYHRIAEQDTSDSLSPLLVTATPKEFDRQLRHLVRHYHPVSADQALAALDGKAALPRGAVLLTFDDGYRDFLEVAWPILKQHRVPAALFVVSAFAAQPTHLFWWDRLWQVIHRAKADFVYVPGLGQIGLGQTETSRIGAVDQLTDWLKLQPAARRALVLHSVEETLHVPLQQVRAGLNLDELRRLRSDGVALAAHTRTHPLLDQLDVESVGEEVRGCRDDLVQQVGHISPMFAYPNGNLNRRVVETVNGARFQAGLTTRPGVNRITGADPLRLRRIDAKSVWPRFVLNLTTPVSVLRGWRHPLPS